MGGDPTGTMSDQHGPQMDEPKLVAVEPAGDGLFKLTCFPDPFPHVSCFQSGCKSAHWPHSPGGGPALRPFPRQDSHQGRG